MTVTAAPDDGVSYAIIETLCYYHVLRRLGFAASELHIGFDAGKSTIRINRINVQSRRYILTTAKIDPAASSFIQRVVPYLAAYEGDPPHAYQGFEQSYAESYAYSSFNQLLDLLMTIGYTIYPTSIPFKGV